MAESSDGLHWGSYSKLVYWPLEFSATLGIDQDIYEDVQTEAEDLLFRVLRYFSETDMLLLL